MTPSFFPNLWERFADFTIRHARLILGIILALTVFFAFFLHRIDVASEVKDFHREDSRKIIEAIEDKFHEGDYADIIFESQSDKSLLTPELLHQQLKVIQEIKKRFKVRSFSLAEGIDEGLKRVKRKSLFDVNDYNEIGQAILALAGPRTVWDLEKVSRHLLSNPDAITYYSRLRTLSAFPLGIPSMRLSGPSLKFNVPYVKAIQAFIQLDPSYTVAEQKEVLASMRVLTDSLATKDLRAYLIGAVLASYDIDKHARKNAFFMGLILLLVDSFFLWAIFRSGKEMFLTLFILVTACIWTFGAASLFGLKFSFLHLIVLPILLGTGIDDNIVFGRRFAEEWGKNVRRRTRDEGRGTIHESLRATFKGTGKGIFLTTFTTLVAFLCGALASSSKAIVSFYLLVSFSMAVVFVLTLFLQGSIRVLFPRRDLVITSQSENRSSPFLKWLLQGLPRLSSRWVGTHPRAIVFVSCILFVGALIGVSKVDAEFDPGSMLRRNMPSFEANKVHLQYFGQDTIGYILMEGKVENPFLLKKMRLLRERMNDFPDMETIFNRANVESVNDLIDKMGIPVGPKTSVREVLDQITMSDKTADFVLNETYKEEAKHLVHKKGDGYDGLIMKFFIRGRDSKKIWAFHQLLEEEMKRLHFDEIPGVSVQAGGGSIGTHLEAGFLFEDLIKSFFLSLTVSFLVLLFAWRKLGPAFWSMIPLGIAVTLTLGLMTLAGMKLSILTVCIGAIAVGLGIDYPIHLIERFAEERRRRNVGAPLQAAQVVLASMGPNLFAAALTTIVGFSVSLVLAMPIAESFGLLTALAIFFVYLASIFLLPVLLIRRG